MKRTRTAVATRPHANTNEDAGVEGARRVIRARLEALRALHASSPFPERRIPCWDGVHEFWRDAPPRVTNELVTVCVEALRALVASVVPRRYVSAVLSREPLAWRFALRTVPHWTPGPCGCPMHGNPAREHAAPAWVAWGLDMPAEVTRAAVHRLPDPMRYGFVYMGARESDREAPGDRGIFVPSSVVDLPELDDLGHDLDAMMRAAPSEEARGAWALYKRTPDDVAKILADCDRALYRASGWERTPERVAEVAPVTHHMRTLARWDRLALAHVALALREVKRDQRSARFFPLPASQEARVPFEVMARGGSYADESRDLWRLNDRRDLRLKNDGRGAGFRVVWDGKPRGEQLSLAFAVRDVVQAEVFRDILRELKVEGLRDYVILHRMAAEQKRAGRLLWTWEAHKRATVHERRVSNSSKSDAAARDAVMNTIWRLAAAELHAEVERNGSRAWKVVGEAPLVNVVGGVEHGGRIEGLELVLNPALYDGARADGGDDLQRYFTQLPEAVLSLPSLPFCLAVMLGFRFRYARDEGGAVVLRAEDLHTFVDAAHWRSNHRADADATLQRAMVDVARAMGEGCTFEPVEGGSYRVTPPRAWVDAVVHNVPPELPPSRQNTPRNGAELLAWREARDLSQTAAAKALGVSVRTIKRAEKRRASTLPRSFRAADWNATPLPSKSLPEPSDE